MTDVQPGDHVLPVFTGECKECVHCKSEESNMCSLLRIDPDRAVMLADGKTRFSKDGKPIYHFLGTSTFSEYTVVHVGCLAKINPLAPLDKVCVVSCGISTGTRQRVPQNWGSLIYSIGVFWKLELNSYEDKFSVLVRFWGNGERREAEEGFVGGYLRIGSRGPCGGCFFFFLILCSSMSKRDGFPLSLSDLETDVLGWKQAAEGARVSGASRIIGVDLNSSRFEQGQCHFSFEFRPPLSRTEFNALPMPLPQPRSSG